jgi:hypothetical protein
MYPSQFEIDPSLDNSVPVPFDPSLIDPQLIDPSVFDPSQSALTLHDRASAPFVLARDIYTALVSVTNDDNRASKVVEHVIGLLQTLTDDPGTYESLTDIEVSSTYEALTMNRLGS